MESQSTMTKNRRNQLSNSSSSGIDRNIDDTAFQRPSGRQRNPNQVNGVQTAGVKGTCIVNNYSIVASRGELARNNCAVPPRETPAPCIVNKKSEAVVNANTRVKHRGNFHEEEFSGEQLLKDVVESTGFGKSRWTIRKSFSVPDNLTEGFPATRKTGRAPGEETILKRSSAFLASLAHSAHKIREKTSNHSCSKERRSLICANDCCEDSCSTKCPTLKEYFSILINDFDPLHRSPSVETLQIERKKRSGARVKKSVSFSSDTSFEVKRAPYRKAAVHEAKVYHKGVLQDLGAHKINVVTKVPSSWDASSEGRSALLRAARDADDTILNEIAAEIRKFGLGNMDANMTDSSGRTAVSYMAGNGAAAMLELALSFEGVDPNIPDNEGNTPLHFAAQAGQTECLNVLLQRCPDIEVDARNASGFTPLMKAALQGRTKCAKILLFAGANPTLRDHGRGLRAEQWARFCGRYVCAEVIERFARHRLLERSTSCRWGSEPELAAKVLQGKVIPIPNAPLLPPSSGFKSKIRKVFRTTSGPDRSFSLVSQLTSAALCASSPALPKPSEVPPVVKSLLRPLSVPQLRVTLVSSQDFLEQSKDRLGSNFTEKIENTVGKPSRSKKKNK
ncbi:unnamed protein product [Xylocopa violacea]|uniref:Ankyrin repeat domain-containing protein 33B n=1 Tax=Xylocopa violacea TaxID=135666 RepID=A0ABP1N1E6_XYLVO